MRSHGRRPIALVGASGNGKTVLAAQFASESRGGAVWISCAGVAPDPHLVATELVRAWAPSRVNRRLPAGLTPADALGTVPEVSGGCIVLDDFGVRLGAEDVAWLVALGSACLRLGVSLVVTTLSVDEWPPTASRDWAFISYGDLALTRHEGVELARLLGVVGANARVDWMRKACQGQPGFYSAIASQVRQSGRPFDEARTPTLRAWMARSISCLGPDELEALVLASLLRQGAAVELRTLGVENAAALLGRIQEVLPLVSVEGVRDGDVRFTVHDVAVSYLHSSGYRARMAQLASAVRLLSERGDYSQAIEVMLSEPQPVQLAQWLHEYGESVAETGGYAALAHALESLPLASLMADASLLVLWARACLETGRTEDALAKAKAARPLAQHENDVRSVRAAMALSLEALKTMNRYEEVQRLASEIVSSRGSHVDDLLRAEARLCLGAAQIMTGNPEQAVGPLNEVVVFAQADPVRARLLRQARNAAALIPALALGDFVEGKRLMSQLVDGDCSSVSMRLMFRGNLAAYLSELGSCERGEAIVRSVLREAEAAGLEFLRGCFLPVLGVLVASRGSHVVGAQLIRDGISLSDSANDPTESAVNRVYLATVLLASGHPVDALSEAEHAMEFLAVQNVMGFRRSAAIIAGAALLQLGDRKAARSWIEAGGSFGPAGNRGHQLLSDCVLALDEWPSAGIEKAESRLGGYADYIRSGSPNLQLSMYSQAFPALPGLLARAVGVDTLPAHMLRMIPPESAEATLLVSREFLDDEMWQALGQRILGSEELERFLARDGVPLCHVRMFAGLEVSVGGRSVRERDWKKRKARLLFVMLMMNNGHDVAREQLFERLWPEMDLEKAKSNLYVTWSLVKSVLMGHAERGIKCPYIESIGGVCHSVPDMVRTDVGDFEKAVVGAREAEKAGDIREALRHYQRIGDLYRGDLLPADCYDDWFSELREHYRIEFINAMLRAGELLVSVDDPSTALIFVRRALRCDPNREDLYQAALRCQIAAGQRTSAIDTYFTCRHKLSEELGLDPSAETRALYDEILAMEDKPRPIARDSFLD